MRAIIVSAVALLALAACSQSGDEAAAPAAAESRTLAGVDLDQPIRVLGTEPFWAVEITPQGLTYSGVDRPEQTAANPGLILQGSVVSWTTTTSDGAELKVTLTATDCSDGMSDRVYPLAAQVEIGDETLTGCAAGADAIARAGEGGRVE